MDELSSTGVGCRQKIEQTRRVLPGCVGVELISFFQVLLKVERSKIFLKILSAPEEELGNSVDEAGYQGKVPIYSRPDRRLPYRQGPVHNIERRPVRHSMQKLNKAAALPNRRDGAPLARWVRSF